MSRKTALVFGSFDLLHRGHRYFLRRSRENAQRLLVVLARDEEIFHLKCRQPAWNFQRRRAALLASGLVDEVFCSDARHGTFYVLQNIAKVDIILLGDGQKILGDALEKFFRANEAFCCPIKYISPHRRGLHSSTKRHQIRLSLAYLSLFAALLLWASSWTLGKFIATSGLAAPFATTLRLSLLAIFFLLWQLLVSGQRAMKSMRSMRALKQKRADCKNCSNTSKKKELQADFSSLIKTVIKAEFALDRPNLASLSFSGFCFAMYNLFFFYGLNAVFASKGGVLTSVLIPCFSALLYSFSHSARLRRGQILGLILGVFSGLILMGLLTFLQGNGSFLSGWQSILFLGTALAWSLITQLSSKIQESCSLPKYSLYTYLFATLWTSWGWFWYDGSIPWLPLLGLVFVGSILGSSLYFVALRFLRPHYVAGFLFLNPVFILLMSWLFLAEPWTLELGIGSILAVLALILLNRKRA